MGFDCVGLRIGLGAVQWRTFCIEIRFAKRTSQIDRTRVTESPHAVTRVDSRAMCSPAPKKRDVNRVWSYPLYSVRKQPGI